MNETQFENTNELINNAKTKLQKIINDHGYSVAVREKAKTIQSKLKIIQANYIEKYESFQKFQRDTVDVVLNIDVNL